MGYEFTVFKGSRDGSIQQSTTHRDALRGDQVLVRVTHSGVCFTDLHYCHTDMGLGHEGTGVVEETGPEVQELKQGDRVGWGYQHDCCGKCSQCLTGWETFCRTREAYAAANLDQGSFASHGVWRESFLYKIPEAISNEDSAPLMCAGSTVFNALHVAQIKPTARVGIVGVGGLGHLAIQFAVKMGCQVVVFSGTEDKKEDAMKFGATEFYVTKGVTDLKITNKLDNLVVTTSSLPDWKQYIGVLNPGATISPLTAEPVDLKFPYMALFLNGFKIQGSVIAARKVHRDMLNFAAFHGIKPVNMVYPLTKEGIEDCLKTLKDGKMRYRGVLAAE
ncbi:chaperonin 10-like protein [Aspergillus coremiiformis]|uniref:Chaperonin 10-like protein n=1 Tax=Aspergillus coremiiformis TaxID=138285 RepID=A0A5N6ZCK5_9EURO|nr:chaperonin 10-like protein [Aspergillus coremiiformis]